MRSIRKKQRTGQKIESIWKLLRQYKMQKQQNFILLQQQQKQNKTWLFGFSWSSSIWILNSDLFFLLFLFYIFCVFLLFFLLLLFYFCVIYFLFVLNSGSKKPTSLINANTGGYSTLARPTIKTTTTTTTNTTL